MKQKHKFLMGILSLALAFGLVFVGCGASSTVNTYTITYNANGANGTPPDTQTVDEGTTVTVAGQGSLTYSGRTFTRWNTSASGTGISYTAGSSLTVNTNVTLYAQWATTGEANPFIGTWMHTEQEDLIVIITANTIDLLGVNSYYRTGNVITFVDNNGDAWTGTVLENTLTLKFDGSIIELIFVRDDNTNENTITITLESNAPWGWQNTYEPADLFNGNRIMQGDEYVFTYSFTSNVELDYLQVVLVDNHERATDYAWIPISDYYIIEEYIPANTVVYGSLVITATGTATNATVMANRLVFQAGTETTSEPTLTFTTLNVEEYDSGDNTTYYTVTYNANGGSGTVPGVQTDITSGSTVTVAGQGSLTYTGRTFSGWNTSAAGTGTFYTAGSSLTVNTNVTLYAQWNIAITSPEGIYVGLIKFAGIAEDISDNKVYLLDQAGRTTLNNYLDTRYTIATQAGTGIYYAVHRALANLTSQEATYPENIDSVNIITFTDGLDNASSGRSAFDPIEGMEFDTTPEYATYIAGQIANRNIADLPVTAYSIGIRGSDVTNISAFQSNLENIASPGKSNELTNFADVQETFNDIADGLNITHTNTSFTMVTTMLDSGTRVRMTFDVEDNNPENAASSIRYIEGTVNRSGTVYTLNNITYSGGVSSSVDSGPIIGTVSGTEINFVFPTITGYTPETDMPKTKQWLMPSDETTWQINSEYSSAGSSTSTVERRSTVIYLVLDCSTSLSPTEIGQIRIAAKNFINSLYDQYAGGSTGSEQLSSGIWANGTITQSGQIVEYSFNVTNGTTYHIWWNGSSEGNSTKTLDVQVSADYSDWTSIFGWTYPGWTNPRSFTAYRTGTVILKVRSHYIGDTGTFWHCV